MKVVRNDTSFIDAEQLNEKINEEREGHIIDNIMDYLKMFNIQDQLQKNERQKVRVDIYMMKTNWIFREIKSLNEDYGKKNDFLQLIDTLDNAEDDSLYTTEFVEALI